MVTSTVILLLMAMVVLVVLILEGKWLCFCGIHLWKNSREIDVFDIYPNPAEYYQAPTRRCMRCGKKERWLPGYGGSELGCWQRER